MSGRLVDANSCYLTWAIAIMIQFCLIILVSQLSTAYDNIALNKPAWQLNPYYPNIFPSDESNAVDGLKSNFSVWGGQCVISAKEKQTATWRVDLEDILSIHHITIYYRTENALWDASNDFTARFLGFSLYVSNTTNITQEALCFHDNKKYTRATIPAVLNISCPVHGRYVIYHNERLQEVDYPNEYSQYAYIELCEVEVYGCPVPGYYGPDCSIPCDTNCRYCHIDTGACQGCKPGYKGHHCKLPCSPHYYGELCKATCGNCSDGVTCNNVDGICTNGCDVGVYGLKCKTTCPVGWHGKNCSLPCTNCDTCDRFTGQCTSPCYKGWKETHCSYECDGGKYGDDCSKDCGACLGYTQCHHINGTCPQGCDAGYKGDLCRIECSPGYFGKNCEQNCSDNCNNNPTVCNRTTGECIGGCRPGWDGIRCDMTCPVGSHGKNCSLTCTNCDKCDGFSGQCTSTCHPGWKGTNCTSECDEGKYGYGCNLDCGACLGYTQCHHVNGTCLTGCVAGYKGDLCKSVCDFGYFGASCREECSVFCQKSRDCHHVTGFCRTGCKSGWRGNDCLEVDSLLQETDVDGSWETRFYGLLGVSCTIVVLNAAYIVYKIRTRKWMGLGKSQKYRSSNSAICRKETASQINDVEKINSGYQELGELSPASTYATIN